MLFADPLREFLSAVRSASRAQLASLFIPASASGPSQALLLHVGDVEPAPEFASIDQADAFVAAHEHLADEDARGAVELSLANEGDTCFVRLMLSIPGAAEPAAEPANERRHSESVRNGAGGEDRAIWVALRYVSGDRPPSARNSVDPRKLVGLNAGDWCDWGLLTAAGLAWNSYRLGRMLHDTTSELPGRLELQWHLRNQIEETDSARHSLGLLLINPDEFALVNHKVGRRQGDQVLREIGRRTQAMLRDSDVLFRYGGAVLAAVVPTADNETLLTVAEKLRRQLSQEPYLERAIRLTFSLGGVAAGAADLADEGLDGNLLLHRANLALNAARLSGGGRALIWTPDGELEAAGNLDRLSGVFTADTEKDYRNMLLLWETVGVVSHNQDSNALAATLVRRLRETLHLDRCALFALGDDDETRLLAMADRRKPDEVTVEAPQGLRLAAQHKALVQRAMARRGTERSSGIRAGDDQDPAAAETYVLPLFAGSRRLGFLVLQSAPDAGRLDSSDLLFLEALARQIAVALDRAQLAEERQRRNDQERQQLRAEVRGLRDALPHASLIYQSATMHTLVKLVEQVAPTEATVLVTGESGTGKEIVARTLHELSHRQRRPFVTVDCGAIAHSLLEAELFGRVKGAYTGADSKSVGRIAMADQGTLFLDEIGELPLEVQAKLLRVVQEHEITPVGGTVARPVDVRIVAATNRDLEVEVAEGRFRRDLYYRLQVVTLQLPTLRERSDDILPLAQFFLEKFALQYRKGRLVLSDAAKDALMGYPWPGNVRELQNRILQAVVLSTEPVIEATQVAPLNGTNAAASLAVDTPKDSVVEAVQPRAFDDVVGDEQDHWQALQRTLRRLIEEAVGRGRQAVVPFGRWLNEDLVIAADDVSEGVASAASSRLGMADTTFRRQRDKLRSDASAGLIARTPEWHAVRPLLDRLVARDGAAAGDNITKLARDLLLAEITEQVADNAALGCRLMGVTLPTYRRWVEQGSGD
ncbi:MAG: sigma 54-interacting transcriptional regulator [Sedimenticolaceae bacterium]